MAPMMTRPRRKMAANGHNKTKTQICEHDPFDILFQSRRVAVDRDLTASVTVDELFAD